MNKTDNTKMANKANNKKVKLLQTTGQEMVTHKEMLNVKTL